MLLKIIFSRKWILTTLLVLLGAALCIRLGIWQLDRLGQRRTFNAHYIAMLAQPPLDLNADSTSDLASMEYRAVIVRGRYDFANQAALLNYYNEGVYGYHLLTPLLLSDGRAVLVDRGWIPAEDYRSGNRARYQEPGRVTVNGILRASKERPDFGWRRDPLPAQGGGRLTTWKFVNIPALQRQMPYELLPAYLQVSPDPAWTGLPARFQPKLELSEGPHMGYALQWFTFALVGAVGYLLYARKRLTQAE